MTPPEQEPARCPTCGSDSPEWCRHVSGSHGHDKTYGPPVAGTGYEDGHRCCSDPFHDPTPPAIDPERDDEVAAKGWMRPHDTYTDCLDGGYKGYQAACWDCDWRGPERLRGDEEMGTPESRAHKRNAYHDGRAHRESAPWVLRNDEQGTTALIEALEQEKARADEAEAVLDEEVRKRHEAEARERKYREMLVKLLNGPDAPFNPEEGR